MKDERSAVKWFRTRYRLTSEGWFVPVSTAPIEYYNPFNLITSGKNNSDSLYLSLANINVNRITEIEDFYNQYGALGILSNEIKFLYRDNDSVVGEDGELETVTEIMVHTGDIVDDPLFMIAEQNKINDRRFYINFCENNIEPTVLDIQEFAGEDLKLFKWEHSKFTALLDMYITIKEDGISSIKEALSSFKLILGNKPKEIPEIIPSELEYAGYDMHEPAPSRGPIDFIDNCEDINWWDENQLDDDMFKLKATEEFIRYLIKEIDEIPKLEIVVDPVSLAISKEIQWKPKSLIRTMYIMLIDDVTSDIQIRRCAYCGSYYRGGRLEMKYCGTACQNRAKTKRYLDQIRNVQKMYANGMKPEDIATSIGKDVDQVKKWIEQKL